MLIKIYPENPSHKQIVTVVESLKRDGVIIYPTDTVYGMGCDIFKPKALDRILKIKGIRKKEANFSFICSELSQVSHFTLPYDTSIFKLMKRCFPGPFTFILKASNNVPDIFQSKKRTIGIRIPDHNIVREIITELGNPIMSTSIRDEDEIVEYTTDPELIHEKYMRLVDIVIDGGYGDNEPSTIIDCTGDEPVIVRQGKGVI